MFINHTSKQVNAKIVFYGPGLSGKTTNLQYIFSITNPKSRGELVSIETEIERTLFFDLLPINVGLINGYQTKFQLYTVPGQIFYDSTRKLVLKGADGIVFVVDSQELMEQANLDSYKNLEKNLTDQKQDIKDIPIVLQYNKRDLKNILTIDRLNTKINTLNVPYFEAIATKGTGVIETLREISSLTLTRIREVIESTKIPRTTPRPAIEFDTDPNHRILKKDELPLRKITVESISSPTSAVQIEHEFVQQKPAPPSPMSLITPAPPTPAMKAQVKPKPVVSSSPSLSALDQMGDSSRITLIRKIQNPGTQIRIAITNVKGETCELLEIPLDQKTKKVNLILDIVKPSTP